MLCPSAGSGRTVPFPFLKFKNITLDRTPIQTDVACSVFLHRRAVHGTGLAGACMHAEVQAPQLESHPLAGHSIPHSCVAIKGDIADANDHYCII
jgi:hypothetical protein